MEAFCSNRRAGGGAPAPKALLRVNNFDRISGYAGGQEMGW
jgi:hypothetical protein